MKLVIIGAGFGGLKLARKLRNKAGFDITLIDKVNHHQFQPLFYQVATAGLDASNISFPLRKIFQKSKNVKIRLGEVRQILSNENKLVTDFGDVYYDKLIIATGADTNFFNNAQLAEHALPMKSTIEALNLRYKILQNFESATELQATQNIDGYLNICIVGGGATGVELSGAIAEMKKFVLHKDFPELDFSKMNIYLFEGSAKTLEMMQPKSSDRSMQYLQKLGVTLKTNTKVVSYDGQVLVTNLNEEIKTNLVIWAAGIKGNVPEGIDKTLLARGNRIKVNRRCQVLDNENIYAIGDVAYMEEPAYPNGHPQVAPVAMQMADMVAENLYRLEMKSGEDNFLDFAYNDKGSMATVGRNLAVVDMPKPKVSLGGFVAWAIWMFLHLMLILGVKNRLFVFINWLYNYFTYDQSLRLIFKNLPQSNKDAK
ncbi:MAG: NAD(P)/FAD-dependent oxidoreductase [Ferruginibacter sp.]|nr:NAD(P)/FAD-dependent oxidoreductase [Ferruginibacter sp.]